MKKVLILSIIMGFFVSYKTQNIHENKLQVIYNEAFLHDVNYLYQSRKGDNISLAFRAEVSYLVGSVYSIYNFNEVFGKWLLVDAKGNIEIPRIGITYDVGKTILEMKELIKNGIKKCLVNPIVDVKVHNKEISILGEVRNPNTIKVDKDYNSSLDLISQSGGFDFYANLKPKKVVRQQGEDVKVTNIDLTKATNIIKQNIQLYPGDIVIEPSKKSKAFDKRIATIIPFTTTVSAAALIFGLF